MLAGILIFLTLFKDLQIISIGSIALFALDVLEFYSIFILLLTNNIKEAKIGTAFGVLGIMLSVWSLTSKFVANEVMIIYFLIVVTSFTSFIFIVYLIKKI